MIRGRVEIGESDEQQIVLQRVEARWDEEFERFGGLLHYFGIYLIYGVGGRVARLVPDDKDTGDEFHYFGRDDCGRGQVSDLFFATIDALRRPRVAHDKHETGRLQNEHRQAKVLDKVGISICWFGAAHFLHIAT